MTLDAAAVERLLISETTAADAMDHFIEHANQPGKIAKLSFLVGDVMTQMECFQGDMNNLIIKVSLDKRDETEKERRYHDILTRDVTRVGHALTAALIAKGYQVNEANGYRYADPSQILSAGILNVRAPEGATPAKLFTDMADAHIRVDHFMGILGRRLRSEERSAAAEAGLPNF